MKGIGKDKRHHLGRSCAVPRVLRVLPPFFLLMMFNSVELCAQVSDGELCSTYRAGHSRAEDYRLKRGDHEVGIWGAGSFDSPTPIGSTYRPVAMLGLRYGRILGTNQLGTLAYVADLIPIQIVFDQENGRSTGRKVYGTGINYGGLKISYLRRSRVKPYAGGSGGLVFYTRPVPLEGRKLNFTYSLDVGIDIFTAKKRTLTVGYRFYHASNGVNTRANVGTNDNLISIGFSFFR